MTRFISFSSKLRRVRRPRVQGWSLFFLLALAMTALLVPAPLASAVTPMTFAFKAPYAGVGSISASTQLSSCGPANATWVKWPSFSSFTGKGGMAMAATVSYGSCGFNVTSKNSVELQGALELSGLNYTATFAGGVPDNAGWNTSLLFSGVATTTSAGSATFGGSAWATFAMIDKSTGVVQSNKVRVTSFTGNHTFAGLIVKSYGKFSFMIGHTYELTTELVFSVEVTANFPGTDASAVLSMSGAAGQADLRRISL
jgi:hypothetical protein